MTKLLSIVVPCYNEEETVEIFYKETIKVLMSININYEIIFVNDGSRDNTIEKIQELINNDKKIGLINLSRNFGKESAMYAGLEHSKGDAVIVMDADLQDHPKYISPMVEKWNFGKGTKVVCTRRVDRKGEDKLKSAFSNLFYKIINNVSDVEFLSGVRDYRLLDRDVVDAILNLEERGRFSKGIFNWVGYDREYIEFENTERVAGETSWSFWKLFVYAVEGIISFSNTPLYISTAIGIVTAFCSFVYFIYLVLKTLVLGIDLPGYASTVSLILFMGGMQLLFIGVVGLYISRIFLEVKRRPIYIAKEVIESTVE